jgi:GNAT superfamily N-acetyltransferase
MTNADLTLRAATIDELPVIASFSYKMFEEMGADEYLDRLPTDWEERFVHTYSLGMNEGWVHYEVAVAHECIVGTCGATIRHNKVTSEFVGRLFDVFVQPDYRGAGLATTLVEHSLSWLRERGCARITLRASGAGRSIYERLGFAAIAEMELRLY